MTEKSPEKIDTPSEPGSGTGRSVRPRPGPEPAAQEDRGAVQQVPIGFPVDAEELKRLKAQAEQPSVETEPAVADQDAAAEVAPVQHVPIGFPVDAEELKRLKARAERPSDKRPES